MSITFEHIDTIGNVILENDLYKQYHYPEMLIRYDSNFIEYKRMPSLPEFMEAESFLRRFHLQYGQQHVKFTFPENLEVTPELVEYLNEQDYSIGKNELYGINPANFPEIPDNPEIRVEAVCSDNFSEYQKLQYNQDVQFGEAFAREKQNLNQKNFENENVMQIIAYYQDQPAGAVDVILSDGYAEIDNLFVLEIFQKRGIGSRLQQFVMDTYPDRTVILVADGEDTPREMYRKQKYSFLGFQHEALKVFEG